MTPIHFYYRFREAILSGQKIQTLRNHGQTKKRNYYYGAAQLVVNPYNSKREILAVVEIRNCIPYRIDVKHKRIQLWKRVLTLEGNAEFAKNEGFETEDEFWFYCENHKISEGLCYVWGKTKYRAFVTGDIVDNILTTDKIKDDENNQQ